MFHWRSTPAENSAGSGSPASPLKTPTLPGGVFAMNRKWFLDSGGYDTGMDVWGGENVEMSFRVSGFSGALEYFIT